MTTADDTELMCEVRGGRSGALGVAALAVAGQAFRAAHARPADVLREE